jgi:dienelactone hydrolase
MNPNPAAALHALVEDVHGPLAAAPSRVTASLLHRAAVARWGDATLDTWRVAWGDRLGQGFALMLMRPAVAAPCPVLVTGDACWAYWIADDVIAAAARAGVALAWFNRTEVHADPPSDDAPHRDPQTDRAAIDALVAQPPHGMAALAAWAWALHRAVDAVVTMRGIDRARIGIAGHSRGGKAALLAAALDARIALASVNNAGTLGVASSTVAGAGSESVAALVRRFPHWVGARLRERVARGEAAQPDMHPLLDAIAPRALLVTQASDDAWANPDGTRHAVERARPVFASRGAPGALRLVERTGGHAQTLSDALAAIDAVRTLRDRAAAAAR